MKYYLLALSYINAMRCIKHAESLRLEQDFFNAAVFERQARKIMGDNMIFRLNKNYVESDSFNAPISIVKAEIIESIHFFRHGFKHWIKNRKYEV